MQSERFPNYLVILANSEEGMMQMDLNSASGIPIPSESMSINERLNSDIFSASDLEYFYVSIRT